MLRIFDCAIRPHITRFHGCWLVEFGRVVASGPTPKAAYDKWANRMIESVKTGQLYPEVKSIIDRIATSRPLQESHWEMIHHGKR